jgi:hypothetical protein
MLIIFFDIKGQAKQSIPHITVTFLRRMRENLRRLRHELWRQKNWLLHHDKAPSHTPVFTRGFLTKNNMTIFLHAPYFSLFPRFKTKLRGRHFDTAEVIEAEPQAVLNSLTEHYLQAALKNARSAGNGACARKGTASRAMVASRSKISC